MTYLFRQFAAKTTGSDSPLLVIDDVSEFFDQIILFLLDRAIFTTIYSMYCFNDYILLTKKPPLSTSLYKSFLNYSTVSLKTSISAFISRLFSKYFYLTYVKYQNYIFCFFLNFLLNISHESKSILSLFYNSRIKLLLKLPNNTIFLLKLAFKNDNLFSHFFVLNNNIPQMRRQLTHLGY